MAGPDQTRDGEWGPWIDHDGMSMPVQVGQLVHRRFGSPVSFIEGKETDGSVWEHVSPVLKNELVSWVWKRESTELFWLRAAEIVRYRVWRSKEEAEQLARLRASIQPENLPAPQREETAA